MSKWISFCGEREITPFQPSVNNVIQFLTTLHEMGLGYSAINTAKSAISSFVNMLNCVKFGDHILIKQFMKGIFQIKPALPKTGCTWNTEVVLKYLSSLFPLSSLTLLQLSGKLAVLLALTTGQRCQTLFYLDVNNIEMCSEYVKFRIGDLLKQSRPKYHLSELYIEAYPLNVNLCVVKTLQEYLLRTEKLRGDVTQLFIKAQKPYNAVTQSTISRWIKSVLSDAGIDMTIFTPHSTRGASTSAVVGKIPIDTILKTAGWTSESVFRKFYKREVTNNPAFGKSILSSVHKV